jgi:hypothetical protein
MKKSVMKTVGWYEEMLKDMNMVLESKEYVLKGYQEDIAVLKNRIEFLRKQVDTAKREGKTSFDRDKYLVRRK